MKKLLYILGILIWFTVILVGLVSYSQTNNYNDLFAIAFVAIIPIIVLLFLKSPKLKDINNSVQINYTSNENFDAKPINDTKTSFVITNPKFSRTNREEELSFQFSEKHQEYI